MIAHSKELDELIWITPEPARLDDSKQNYEQLNSPDNWLATLVRTAFKAENRYKGIGLCYWWRTQQPLTPREARAAKPSAKRWVLHKRLADAHRFRWPFWASFSRLNVETEGWFWCNSTQLVKLFRMSYYLYIQIFDSKIPYGFWPFRALYLSTQASSEKKSGTVRLSTSYYPIYDKFSSNLGTGGRTEKYQTAVGSYRTCENKYGHPTYL